MGAEVFLLESMWNHPSKETVSEPTFSSVDFGLLDIPVFGLWLKRHKMGRKDIIGLELEELWLGL